MEKQIKQKKSRLRNNITRFRQDKRLMVVGSLRSLALLGMLGTVIYCIWNFHEDLNIQNFKRIVSYVQATMSDPEDFARYSFESGADTICQPFQLGLAVADGGTYRFVSGIGEKDFSIQLKYSNPVLSVGDSRVLIYDCGNYSFCVANSYASLYEETLQSPIISASMNRDGDFAIVTSESGYKSAVAVYDKKFKMVCKWQTPDYYVMLSSVSPDGDSFANLCISESLGQIGSKIIGFATDSEEPIYTIDLGSRNVYSLKHYKNGDLVIVCEDGVYIYDSEGKLAGESLFASQLVMYCHREEDLPVLALKAQQGVGEQIQVRVVGPDGETVFEKQYHGSIRDIDYSSGTVAMLFSSKLITADISNGEEKQADMATGAREVMVDGSGMPILMYSDRAEKISLDAEEQETE